MKKNTDAVVKNNEAITPYAPLHEERALIPAAEITETDDAYTVFLDLPGAEKGSISVTVEKGMLSVKASRAPHHGEGAQVLFREIEAGSYERAFSLGDGIDLSNVDASYEDGVLTLKLFKTEDTKPREVTIR